MVAYTPSRCVSYACTLLISLLSACGGGGGNSANVTLTGSVIDGYIEGAKVCLDVNANGLCEASEPSTLSDSLGKYKLAIGNANTAGVNVVAEIPDSAKDSDDEGLTLLAAGKMPYTMTTLATQPSVVTPLTTLVSGKMKTEGLTHDAAKLLVMEELGLPSNTNPYEDHIEKGNALVHGASRQVAAQLQQARYDLPTGTQPEDRWAKTLALMKSRSQEAGALSGVPSTVNGADPLNMPASLSAVASGYAFSYTMPSVKGKTIKATAMAFAPKTLTMPTGGWPMVVFGHGTVGVAQTCAPSVTMKATGNWDYATLVAALVSQGVVVVAPDYEGLGSSDMGVTPGHPYLNFGSAGRSMALSAVAAKQLLLGKLSGAWAAVGHSQGGHAALASAQFASLAKAQSPTLNFKGAIAVAPASNLLSSLNTMWAAIQSGSSDPSTFQQTYAMVGLLNFYTAYVVKGTQSTPRPIDANRVFGANMRSIYETSAGSQCLDEFSTTVARDVGTYAITPGATPANYPGVLNATINTPPIVRILSTNEPGQVKLPGKILVVQGSADTTVLPSSTNALISTMTNKGTDVTLSYHDSPSATHSGVLSLAAAQAAMARHLASLFATN